MTFPKLRRSLLLVSASSLLLAAACSEQAEEQMADAPDQSLTEFLTDATYAGLRQSPEGVSAFGLSEEEVGIKASDKLSDRSPAAEEQGRQTFKDNLEALKAYDRESLSDDEKLYYDIAMSTAEDALPLLEMPGPFSPNFPSIYRISQMGGPHTAIPQLLQAQHQVSSVADAEDFIARLNAVGSNFEGFLQAWEQDIANGLIPPTFALEKTSATIGNFVSEDPTTNPFYGIFAGKLGGIEDLSDEKREELMASAAEAISNSVVPGYSSLKARVDALIPESQAEAGVWAKPGGEEFYKVAVKIFTGTNLTPEEVHNIGLAEVERITGEMEAILQANGLTEGTRGDRLQELVSRTGLVFTNDDAGRDAILQYLNDNKAFMAENAPNYFSFVPEVDVDIQRIPAFQEASAPGGYYTPPSLDGSRPGIFWINLRDPSQTNVAGLKSLLYHEAVPGHHFELAQAITATDRPIFRRLFFSSNYSEGWGLYAEKLAEEMGAYEGDPVGDLGRLGSELFRAARLVVDTGMHAKGWSREDALQFMGDTYGVPVDGFVSEIERYSVIPGQALGYKMGMIKLLELRDRAQAALGDRFDIKAFHDVILGGGSMPMPVVEARVDAWIASQS